MKTESLDMMIFEESFFFLGILSFNMNWRDFQIMRKKIFLLFNLFIIHSSQVFAHEYKTENGQKLFDTFGFSFLTIFSAFIALFFAIFYFITKSKMNRVVTKRGEAKKQKKRLHQTIVIVRRAGAIALILFFVSLTYTVFRSSSEDFQQVALKHIHGLGYNFSGQKIYVSSHNGLKVFTDGHWHVPNAPRHDYMGFSMVDDGFYSSGHPAPTSDLANPLGIVKSQDYGKTLKAVAFLGEVDFHHMAVGYQTHVIWVYNPIPHANMQTRGFYYSVDEGQTWKKSAMAGVVGKPSALAVHPTKKNIFAVGTNKGVFLSNDFGNSFQKLLPDIQVTALSFDQQGNLMVGGIKKNVVLIKRNLKTKKTKQIQIPNFQEDFITWIAKNPQNEQEMVFATLKRNLYLTWDNGTHWHQIAHQGKGINIDSAK